MTILVWTFILHVFGPQHVCHGTGNIAHSTNLLVGSGNGEVTISAEGIRPGRSYLMLDRIDGFLHGWSNNDPGFDHVSDAGTGTQPLPVGSMIVFEVDEFAPAFIALDSTPAILADTGDATYLGNAFLHQHFTWFINEDDPAYDESECVWEASFHLWDESEILEPSAVYTLLFTNREVRLPGVAPDGDGDADGDVDLDDHHICADCMNGPLLRPDIEQSTVVDCEVTCHNAFDFDDDLDIDLRDIADWQLLME